MSGWELPEDACALLRDLVLAEQPALAVEAGSGRSTVVIAETLRELGAGRLVALEHDPGYAAETERLLAAARLRGIADVRHAPLHPHGEDLEQPDWYAREAWADLHGIGFLLVDGPPGGVGRKRAPALPLLRSRLLPGCLVVLDDVDRPDEAAILAEWDLGLVQVFRHAKASLAYGRAMR